MNESVFNEDEEMVMTINFIVAGGTLAEANNISLKSLENIYSSAHALYQSEQYEKAGKYFQYLCFHDHRNPRYFLGLGACQKMLRCFGQSIKTFEYASKLDPKDPSPMIYKGDCMLILKKGAEAKEFYKKALQNAETNNIHLRQLNRIKNTLNVL